MKETVLVRVSGPYPEYKLKHAVQRRPKICSDPVTDVDALCSPGSILTSPVKTRSCDFTEKQLKRLHS